ncbi:MAG TPA: hypothetical protein VGZ00_11025 [Candidatus Baltobacteraceae bacterium]|jgi:hypothetical protein|nr:hypothetical protein [Candidatus Baltobacteraceae bacterium]
MSDETTENNASWSSWKNDLFRIVFPKCSDGTHSAEKDQLEHVLKKMLAGIFDIAYAANSPGYSKGNFIEACKFSEAELDLGTRVIDAFWGSAELRHGYTQEFITNLENNPEIKKRVGVIEPEYRSGLADSIITTLGGHPSCKGANPYVVQISATSIDAYVKAAVAYETAFEVICSLFENPEAILKGPRVQELPKRFELSGEMITLRHTFKEELRVNSTLRSEFAKTCLQASIDLFKDSPYQGLYNKLTNEQKSLFFQRIDERLLGMPPWNADKIRVVLDVTSRPDCPPKDDPRSESDRRGRRGKRSGP